MKYLSYSLLLTIGIFASAGANACSCAQSSTAERYANARQVFLAKATGTRQVTGTDRSTHVEATVQVVETFKGTPRDGDILRDGLRPKTYCELGLTKGQTYLVYLGNSDWVGMCSSHRYRPAEDSAEISQLRTLRRKD